LKNFAKTFLFLSFNSFQTESYFERIQQTEHFPIKPRIISSEVIGFFNGLAFRKHILDFVHFNIAVENAMIKYKLFLQRKEI